MGKYLYDQSRAPIYEALERFREMRVVPFDVPGHKHGKGNPELTAFLGEKCVGVEPEPVETEEPVPEEAEPETGGNTGMLLAVLAVALVGGGAAFYFKVLRPKQQKAAEPQEDYGDELPDYDGPDGYGDEDDDGPPWDEEDDNGEEADK